MTSRLNPIVLSSEERVATASRLNATTSVAPPNLPAPTPDSPLPAPSLFARLDHRTPPHFNQLVVWTLLATALTLAVWPFAIHDGPRGGFVSLLSWLPTAAVRSSLPWNACRFLLLLGIGLWALNRWLPWSCWLATLAFTALWSLHVETTHNTAHIFNMANMLMVIQSLWITAEAPLIRQSLRSGAYWKTPLVPRWVSLASIAYIGIFHTAAGLSKLSTSGLGWANGTSLQLWTYHWGRPWSPTTWLLLSSRTAAQALQVFTLLIETAGILAIFPGLRSPIGWGLLGFYAGVLATFDYGFQYNALLTVLYLLPVERWIAARFQNATPRVAT